MGGNGAVADRPADPAQGWSGPGTAPEDDRLSGGADPIARNEETG